MNSFCHLSLAVVFSVLAFADSVPSARKSSIVIGDHLYFTDVSNILRSRAQALAYCESQEAELAKVTDKALYDRLRLALSNPSTYWIDGIDKENHDRFSVSNNCTSEVLDYSDMPSANLFLAARTCLTLVKGATAAESRIQAMECIIPNRVLCSFHLNGCAVPTTTTSTEEPSSSSMASGDSVVS